PSRLTRCVVVHDTTLSTLLDDTDLTLSLTDGSGSPSLPSLDGESQVGTEVEAEVEVEVEVEADSLGAAESAHLSVTDTGHQREGVFGGTERGEERERERDREGESEGERQTEGEAPTLSALGAVSVPPDTEGTGEREREGEAEDQGDWDREREGEDGVVEGSSLCDSTLMSLSTTYDSPVQKSGSHPDQWDSPSDLTASGVCDSSGLELHTTPTPPITPTSHTLSAAEPASADAVP
ncbi:hypothetical protein KIPB_014938, partial [Kipferlia bialata]